MYWITRILNEKVILILNLKAKKSAKTDDLRYIGSKISTFESSNSIKEEETFGNNYPIPSRNSSEFLQKSPDSGSEGSCNDVQKTQKLFAMYFCILFGVLVVSGIFVGIGIHFARLPNRNSGEMNVPSEEKQKGPKTGELKINFIGRKIRPMSLDISPAMSYLH